MLPSRWSCGGSFFVTAPSLPTSLLYELLAQALLASLFFGPAVLHLLELGGRDETEETRRCAERGAQQGGALRDARAGTLRAAC